MESTQVVLISFRRVADIDDSEVLADASARTLKGPSSSDMTGQKSAGDYIEGLSGEIVDSSIRIDIDSPPVCEIDVHSSTVVEPDDKVIVNPKKLAAIEENGEDELIFWQNPLHFLCSSVAMSVGIGNIWMFPFVAHSNGGGAFIFAYVIVMVFMGTPLYTLDMALGQFASAGPIAIWGLAPFFRGVGYCVILSTFCGLTSHVSLMCVALRYMLDSFRSMLPWSQCDAVWTSNALCVEGVFQPNKTNFTLSELYYSNKVFQAREDIQDGIGVPNMDLTICLLLCWLVIFATLLMDLKNSGKLSYFTSILPFMILLILFVRGISLPGGWAGMAVFIKTDFAKLMAPGTWFAAIAQAFYSLSVGSGPVTHLASNNKFNHNIYRVAKIVSITDIAASTVSGLTTFAIIGNLADELGVRVFDFADSVPNIAFTIVPQAIVKMEFIPQLFSVLYFLMLVALTFGSAIALTKCVSSILWEQFPNIQKWKIKLTLCAIGFSIGMIYITPGSRFMTELASHFGTGFVIYIAVILEVVTVCHIYGINKFCSDVELMLNYELGFHCKVSWRFIIPLGLIANLIHIFTLETQRTSDSFGHSTSAIVAGWLLSAAFLLMIPIFAVRAVCLTKSSGIVNKIKSSLRADHNWCPKTRLMKQKWMEHRAKRSESKA